jgi:hypothetical protein
MDTPKSQQVTPSNFEMFFRAVGHTDDMNSTTQDSLSIDSLGAYSQPANGNVYTAPAPLARTATNKIVVPRRLADNVQLSRESAGDEEGANSLCSNFMAAWG